jgi:hypothetical protein
VRFEPVLLPARRQNLNAYAEALGQVGEGGVVNPLW